MRITVMAAGAVGGYFGGRMAAAGHDVTFIALGAHAIAGNPSASIVRHSIFAHRATDTATEGRAVILAPWALRLRGLDLPTNDEPFAAVIRCTSDPSKVDKRTRSKWSRLLRYAAECKTHSEPLAAFVQRKGGINACAERFTRCLRKTIRRLPEHAPRM